VVPDVSEERIASIFRVVEYDSTAASTPAPPHAQHGVISQKKILFMIQLDFISITECRDV
jgi:hypothetical protein